MKAGNTVHRTDPAAVPGHVLVTADRWLTQPVGWWGPQDAGQRAADLEYLTTVNEVLDAASDGERITCVDYHS